MMYCSLISHANIFLNQSRRTVAALPAASLRLFRIHSADSQCTEVHDPPESFETFTKDQRPSRAKDAVGQIVLRSAAGAVEWV
jgi:hypothetical protein